MLEILIAFGLDLIFGDPVYAWHPARVIGGWVGKSEKWLRARVPDAALAGIFLAAFVPSVTFLIVWFLTSVADEISPALKSVLSVYFLYSAISVKDLRDHVRRIYISLHNDRLDSAREKLSQIVGRDTKDLDTDGVVRASVESAAESFVDGVLSPLFYAALGGAPLAMAYKAINTLDSMVGRKTPQYVAFGRAAAKLDEIVNWVPARISWLLIGVGAFFTNGRGTEAWRVGLEDGVTAALNSTTPEAAFAGALGVELGGTNYYDGKAVETPKVGYPLRALERRDIQRASRLVLASSFAALPFSLFLQYLVYVVFH